jgi:arylsulfatase A-like enzyme
MFNEDREKLFFFSQEFQRRRDPTAERRVTVPTALERHGDFIARWPGVIRPGTTRRQVGHVIDILPTFLAAAGTPPRPLEGRHLFHGNPDEPRTLFWEHEGNRAVRQGEWKLVAVHSGPWELYDLGKDRTELSSPAAARPDRVRALRCSTTNGPRGAA